MERAVLLDGHHASCLADMLESVKPGGRVPLFYRVYREGHDAVVERMRPLAADFGLNLDARGLLARPIWRHDKAAKAKSETDRLLTGLRFSLKERRQLSELAAAGRMSMTDVTSTYGLWAKDAQRLRRTAERILGDGRYGDHLDRIANARTEIAEGSDRLWRALKTDAAYRELVPRLARPATRPSRTESSAPHGLLERPEPDPGAQGRRSGTSNSTNRPRRLPACGSKRLRGAPDGENLGSSGSRRHSTGSVAASTGTGAVVS